jgi:hypothetical protein
MTSNRFHAYRNCNAVQGVIASVCQENVADDEIGFIAVRLSAAIPRRKRPRAAVGPR